jgi:N-acyl-D-amino-acid deacylase
MPGDLAIVGGVVVDGTGAAPYPADVVVTSGRIAGIAPPGEHGADRMLDARGRVVAPGFIDMHAHSDLQILATPDHASKLLQGVTTEVGGQDGLSYAPVDDEVLLRLRAQLKGWNDDPDGFDWNWRSVAGYLDRLDRRTAVNMAYLVPHGNLRLLVVGGENRRATPAELDRMSAILRESLAAGAVGMSAGLTYVPALYADVDELVALCRVVAEAGGYYCPHHRGYGIHAIESYAECVDVARRSGVALHLAHTHLSFPVNAGRLGELTALIDGAIAEGIDLTFDSYPYLAGMTSLHSLLPGWAQEGGTEETLARLADPAVRERVRHALDVTGSDGHHGMTADWSTIVVAGLPDAPRYEGAVGRSVADTARDLDIAPSELFLDLVTESRLGASCVLHIGIEEHVRALMRHPRHTVGSDGILVGDRPHPRAWGTFARMLGRYVREEQVLDLVTCVRHMTSAASDRIGAPDRGRLLPGACADIVVFDPETVMDRATYETPRLPAAGIDHVLVNGAVAVRDGALTGARAGRVVRRT